MKMLESRLDGVKVCTYAFTLFDGRWLKPHYDKAAFISGITLEQMFCCLDGIAYDIMVFTDGDTVMTNFRRGKAGFPYAGDFHESKERAETKAVFSYFGGNHSYMDAESFCIMEGMTVFWAALDRFMFST